MTNALPKLNYTFDDFADMFVALGAFGTPSELHGLLAGQLAAGVRADAEAWLAMVGGVICIAMGFSKIR